MPAPPPLAGHALLVLLLEVAVLLALSRLLGELAKRLELPSGIAELVAGVSLGPSLLGASAPGVYAALLPPQVEQAPLLEAVPWLGMVPPLMHAGLAPSVRHPWR